MVSAKLKAIIENIDRAQRASAGFEERAAVERRQQVEFREAWGSAYSKALFQSPEFVSETADGLLRLRQPINDRLWEYWLVAHSRADSLLSHEKIAVELLLEAIFADRPSVVASLELLTRQNMIGSGILTGIVEAHDELRTYAENARDFVAYTPPLNQKQCARVFGMTHGMFRAALKAGRIIDVNGKGRYARLRRWRHQDAYLHACGLRMILKIFPEKVWSKDRE